MFQNHQEKRQEVMEHSEKFLNLFNQNSRRRNDRKLTRRNMLNDDSQYTVKTTEIF